MRGTLRALAFGIGLLGVTNMAQAAEVRALYEQVLTNTRPLLSAPYHQ